jgi:hypothetical protein
MTLTGSKGTFGGIRAQVRCCLHSWDLTDQIFPEYMALQTEREDFEDDFTVDVLTVRVDHRSLEHTTRVVSALVKLWDYLEQNELLFGCAECDDASALPAPGYIDEVKQTVAGRKFCDKLAALNSAVLQLEETDELVSRIEKFCGEEN